jgi:hypothetical protein
LRSPMNAFMSAVTCNAMDIRKIPQLVSAY